MKKLLLIALASSLFMHTQGTKFDINLLASSTNEQPIALSQQGVCFCNSKSWKSSSQNITLKVDELSRTSEQEATFRVQVTVKNSLPTQPQFIQASPTKSAFVTFDNDAYSFTLTIEPSKN